jgi:dCTP deaminase
VLAKANDVHTPEIIRVARQLLLALDKRVRSARAFTFPSPSPKGFIELYLRILQALADELNRIESHAQLDSSPHRPGYIRERARWVMGCLGRIAPWIRFIEHARLRDNPWGIVGRLQHLCQMIDPNLHVILRPRWRHIFDCTPLTDALREDVDPDKGLLALLDEVPRYVGFSFPCLEDDNTLLTAIWAHELGHEVDRKIGEDGEWLTLQVEKEVLFDPQGINDLVEVCLQSEGFPLPPSEKAAERVRVSIIEELSEPLHNWLREIIADVIAIHLVGPAAMFALYETTVPRFAIDAFSGTHPPARMRLQRQIDELEYLGYFVVPPDQGERSDATRQAIVRLHELLVDECSALRDLVTSQETGRWTEVFSDDSESVHQRLIRQTLARALDIALERIRGLGAQYFYSPRRFWQQVPELITLLEDGCPPCVQEYARDREPEWDVPAILNAGWLHWRSWLSQQKPKEPEQARREAQAQRTRVNQLVLKAIEVSEFQFQYWARRHLLLPLENESLKPLFDMQDSPVLDSGAMLAVREIEERLNAQSDRRLFIAPLLDRPLQMQPTGIDVRLGNVFIRMHQPRFPAVDPVIGTGFPTKQFQERTYVPLGEAFILHPGQMVLGCTLEYIGMPTDLVGEIHIRSSWASLGLTTARPAELLPGARTAPTLHLINVGTAPIMLYPGMRIGLLTLQHLSSPVLYKDRCNHATEPEHSKVDQDNELGILGPVETLEPFVMVALTGLPQAGKTFVANQLALRHGYRRIAAEQFLDRTLRNCGVVANESSDLRASLREQMGNTFVVSEILKDLKETRIGDVPQRIVIDHLDHPDEISAFKQKSNGFVVAVEAAEDLRRTWYESWHPSQDDDSCDVFAERERWHLTGHDAEGNPVPGAPCIGECLRMADFTVVVTGESDLVVNQIDQIVAEIEARTRPSALYSPNSLY